MAMAMQYECRHCPINSDCKQWTAFDISKCKAYTARNVLAQLYFNEPPQAIESTE